MTSLPSSRTQMPHDQHVTHDHDCGCMTLRLLRNHTEEAQSAYLHKFGAMPHEETMFFVYHWDLPEVLEGAVRSGTPIPPSKQGIEFEAMCREYRERFGHEVIPRSIWLWGGPEDVFGWIREALQRGRRRWVLECGDTIEGNDKIFAAAGLDPENTTIEDMLHIWLDPIESIREVSAYEK